MTSSQPVNNPSIVWTRFLVAFARLFAFPVREAAAFRLAPFEAWGSSVLNEMGSDAAAAAIGHALQELLDREDSEMAARMMIEELDAFTTYVERLTGIPIAPDITWPDAPTYQPPPTDPIEVKESFSIGKVILDSLTDLLDKLPFSWKAGLKALSELASIAGINR